MKISLSLLCVLLLAACGGGGGGSGAFGPPLTLAQQANVATASQASLASSQSQTANASVSTAVTNLSDLVTANASLSSNSTVTVAALAAQQAAVSAASAQNAAATAASDLMIASNFSIVGVISAGRTICAAASSCTSAEISALGYIAASTAKNAAEATLFAITATNQLKTIISTVAPTVNLATATAAIATATSSASTAQATANTAISNYAAAAIQVGTSVITITPSSGTTGSVTGTPTYSGATQTIVTTFANGQTSTATNAPVSSPVTWAADNVTRTTTHTFANGGTNAVVATVPGTVGAPTYSGSNQTIVTTFGNGQTSTVVNAATGTPVVTWASDNVTRTTSYTYANGGSNAVVATVPGTAGTPVYSGATQTIVTTFANGQTSTATNTATGNSVAWGSDNVTRTTTYTFANGGTSAVVATVPGTAGTPTYSGTTQTIVTTFANGQTSTATNNSTSNAVTWAADHVTKTTTYTYANGGTNPVVTTVPPTTSNPTLTTANYPANWTTTGVVTPPRVSSSTVTYGDGYSFVQDGTTGKSFWQSTLSRNSITDPSALVYSTTAIYDLRWGTPDKSGPSYSAEFSDGAVNFVTLTRPVTQWGQTISGQCLLGPVAGFCLNGASISTPHPEVLEAWRKGWTGKGVNVVIEDWLQQAHGATTTVLTNRYAIASNIYGFNVPTNAGIYNFDGTQATPSSNVAIGVVNASYGANLRTLIGRAGQWTDAELNNAAVTYSSMAQRHINRFTGSTSGFNYTDAVIVKAAGNDAIAAHKEPLVKALADNSAINPRLLIVGALNMAGFTSAPATLANSYSNFAGSYSPVSDRFLVASGTTPFGDGYMAINGVPITSTTSVDPDGVNLGNVGTSYAAPRVSGYVAILRQKFPNLNAEKSSSIMLDTARYDTLSCNPNCDPAIYGKGEASLSRALAPVGRLR